MDGAQLQEDQGNVPPAPLVYLAVLIKWANVNLAKEILALLCILGDIMNYRVFPPCEVLAECVKCFWTLEDEATEEPARQRIMPDGCMEMIFHYGDLYRPNLPANTSMLRPRAFVYGQITT